MTNFKYSLQACGLSQTEAAEFLGKSLQSIKDYCRGKSNPPPEVWKMISELYFQVQNISDCAANALDLEGLDFRAYNNISATGALEKIELPNSSCANMADAVGFLKALLTLAKGE